MIKFIKFQLRNFWQQLLADKAFFSACGMCRIDRQLLTSVNKLKVSYYILSNFISSYHSFQMSGAIATYLVILLQFQKSNG